MGSRSRFLAGTAKIIFFVLSAGAPGCSSSNTSSTGGGGDAVPPGNSAGDDGDGGDAGSPGNPGDSTGAITCYIPNAANMNVGVCVVAFDNAADCLRQSGSVVGSCPTGDGLNGCCTFPPGGDMPAEECSYNNPSTVNVMTECISSSHGTWSSSP
jgi:hypothetical protein